MRDGVNMTFAISEICITISEGLLCYSLTNSLLDLL